MFRSGFVNILGKPNAGKSTLMNILVGERMSIITAKPQTTRHRIIGILSGDDFQIVFSDTPGFIKKPAYKMQEVMNKFVLTAFEDADLVLFLIDATEKPDEDDPLAEQLKTAQVPVFLIINKTDLVTATQVQFLDNWWNQRIAFAETWHISALNGLGTAELLQAIIARLPEGPQYYPKDQLTDRPERFFVAEIIREKIMELYHQEIPYSVEVNIESFKEKKTPSGEDITVIHAIIYVIRESQKMILLGKKGTAMKRLGTLARQSLEAWLQTKVFLDLHVKVRDNWRDDENQLKRFGYEY